MNQLVVGRVKRRNEVVWELVVGQRSTLLHSAARTGLCGGIGSLRWDGLKGLGLGDTRLSVRALTPVGEPRPVLARRPVNQHNDSRLKRRKSPQGREENH